MHHKHITAGLAAALFTLVLGDATSAVTQLTKDNFTKYVNDNAIALVEFYAPWCGHCKALAPEYDEASLTLKEHNIPLAKVDCTEEAELCKQYGVEGYPTLKVFRGPDDVKPYTAARKADAIVPFMIKQSLPAVSVLFKETIEDFKTADHVVIIAYVDEDDKASKEVFEGVGAELRDKFYFGITHDAALAEAEGVQFPAIVLHKDFDDGKALFVEKFEADDIMSFIQVGATPEVGEVGPETYSAYIATRLPLAYYFADTPEERKEYAELIKVLARKYKGKINIATIDSQKYGSHATNINLKADKFPAFAIQDVENNKKYPFDQDKAITLEAITDFLESFVSGTLEPSIKSEEVPESQDGPVVVAVGKTFEEIVIANTQADVLVEFYAPWCGHCKSLAPKYEDVGSLYKGSEHKDKVVIVKIDATANDIPVDIKGFPTLFLFPAGDKKNPVEYNGDRTVADMVKFIGENGSHKAVVEIPEEAAPEEAAEEKKAEEKAEEKKEEKKAEEKKEEKEEKKKEEEEESHDEL